jgi:hypothetical protein
VVADAATVTDAGTVNRTLLLERATIAPPAGAAPVSVTVQLAAAELAKVVGRHTTEVGTMGAVTVPPVAEIVIELPAAEAPNALLTPIAVLATPEAIVRFTTASGPFVMMLAFKPEATQV